MEINTGQIGEQLNNKADLDLENLPPPLNKIKTRYVIETYVNGPSWYTLYSDGWCEQGDYMYNGVNGWQNLVCNLLIPYRDTYYHVSITSAWGGNGDGASYYYANTTKLTTQFTANVANLPASYGNATWKASGYTTI